MPQLKKRLNMLSQNEEKLASIFSEITENNTKVQKEINYKSLENEERTRKDLDRPIC